MTDDELDEDYAPSLSTRSQSKKKSRSSQVLSTSSAKPSKRVRLADVISGAIPKPPMMGDSSGGDFESATISASKTLESR